MASYTRKWPWLVGLLALIVLTLLCLWLWERDLRSDSSTALSGIGLAALGDGIDVSGQTVTLTGTVEDEAARAAAEQAVAGVDFVREVDNQLVVAAGAAPDAASTTTTAPTTTAASTTTTSTTAAPTTTVAAPTVPPSLRGTVEGGQIVLEGLVPTQAIADDIVAAAAAQYGAGNVTSLIAVQDDVIDADWLADGAVLPLLGVQPDGGFAVDGSTITLLGEVPDEATSDALEAQAARTGLAVDNQLTITPSIEDRLDELAVLGIGFESGSAVLTEASEAVLDEVAAILIANPDVEIEIQGHTDSDGSAGANLTLSQERADAVEAYLIEAGADGDNLTPIGYGETEPIADNTTPEGKEANRRIEFVITGGV